MTTHCSPIEVWISVVPRVINSHALDCLRRLRESAVIISEPRGDLRRLEMCQSLTAVVDLLMVGDLLRQDVGYEYQARRPVWVNPHEPMTMAAGSVSSGSVTSGWMAAPR